MCIHTQTHTFCLSNLSSQIHFSYLILLGSELYKQNYFQMHCHILTTRFSLPVVCTYIYLFYCVRLILSLFPPYSHVVVVICFQRPLQPYTVFVGRCQYLTLFLFYPIYLFIMHFRNHFYIFRLLNGSWIYSTTILYMWSAYRLHYHVIATKKSKYMP